LIIESFLLSLIAGFVRRGSLRNLEKMPLRQAYLFVIGSVLAGAILTLIIRGGNPALIHYARIVNVAQYLVLLVAIGLNLHIRGMIVVGVGTFFNCLVLTANGGLMPVSKDAIVAAGLAHAIRNYAVRHVILSSETRLPFLSDIVPVRLFGPLCSQVISVGDIIIALSIFFMIQYYMCRPAPAKEPVPSG
jgi:hypothetical protein